MSGASGKLRVAIADDHPEVLAHVQSVLARECDVVAAVRDGESLLEAALRSTPDIVVCDVSMPGMTGFDVARSLARFMPEIKVIFLTVHAEWAYVAEAFHVGASGYVVKASSTELVQAIRAVAAGGTFCSAKLKGPACA